MTGKELSNVLKKKGITIKEFSKMINITEDSLKLYLKDNSKLRNDIIVQTSKVLDLDLQSFSNDSKIISRRNEEINDIDFEDINKLLDK